MNLSFYKNKKVLVTGGCGFIGSHLAEKLVNLNAQVTIVDNLSTGSLANISSFKDRITLIIASITDQLRCASIVSQQEIIFHLAAFTSVPLSVHNPLDCHLTNIDGTLYLLEAARLHGVSRFIFSSSSAVYGTTTTIAKETDSCSPTSPYGMSKLIGELYCQQYSRHYNISSICLRYFNVYGSRQNFQGSYAPALAAFRYRMANNLPITIFGDGTQIRDFISVEHVVEANIRGGMLAAPFMDGQAINIATGRGISINELIRQLHQEYPSYAGTISFAPSRPGDAQRSEADCTAYRSLL